METSADPSSSNKVFFFVNYEGDRTHITNINALYEIPSALRAFEDGEHSGTGAVLAQMAPLPAGCNVIPAPASCAVANTEELDPATGLPDGNGAQLVYSPAALPDTLREDTGSAKIDWNISDKDRIFFRYNINDSLTNYTYGLNHWPSSPQAERTQLAKIDETHTFSSEPAEPVQRFAEPFLLQYELRHTARPSRASTASSPTSARCPGRTSSTRSLRSTSSKYSITSRRRPDTTP